ncbi:MAG: hypothetical protein NZ518_04725 [Dehalococcoidia bacterium]|nr:hypothetical protein [Dehalococcoidia bacterium]
MSTDPHATPPSIRRDLEWLAERHGPLEVAVIMAPEEFVAEKGVRRLAGAYRLAIGAVSMKQPRNPEEPLENIGDLTLVLTDQTATALYHFLGDLLGKNPDSPRKKRQTMPGSLPIVTELPEE